MNTPAHAVLNLVLLDHRHFLPLSGWRFLSPVSYWDPRHFGRVVAPLEAAGVLAASLVLARRFDSPWSRRLLGGVAALYVVYLSFALWMWTGALTPP